MLLLLHQHGDEGDLMQHITNIVGTSRISYSNLKLYLDYHQPQAGEKVRTVTYLLLIHIKGESCSMVDAQKRLVR